MSNISVTNINDGDAVTATSVNNQVNTIVNDYNGNVDNTNIKTGANIATAKLATDAGITSGMIGGLSYSTASISNPYKFNAYRTSALSTTGGSFIVIAYDTENFDTNSNFDSTSTKGTYTAPVAGFYQFNAQVQVAITGTTQLAIALYKNGSVIAKGSAVSTTAATNTVATSCIVSTMIQLAAGNTVDARVFCNGSTGLTVGSADATWFSGFLVSQT